MFPCGYTIMHIDNEHHRSMTTIEGMQVELNNISQDLSEIHNWVLQIIAHQSLINLEHERKHDSQAKALDLLTREVQQLTREVVRLHLCNKKYDKKKTNKNMIPWYHQERRKDGTP